MTSSTIQALAAITDEGLFERLATAVLRESNPVYHALIHPGVSVHGKTVKSPLDGICFEYGSNPPHMIAVHHTTTKITDLEKKWLHDPSKVKARKSTGPTAPAGDLIKTAEIIAQERKRTPNLRATLVLTTNEEPSEALVRSVEAVGRNYAIFTDIWSRSRLCHFLDNHATGQWIRYSYLDIEQELLSAELLKELCKKSLEIHAPMDNKAAWISRTLDETITTALRRSMTFLVAGSGLGKSVACYRTLVAHVEAGGFGIVLPHEVIATAMTVEQAINTTLRQLHPPLATISSALSFCTPEQPLFIIVEDINRSGQAHILAEKLAGWGSPTKKSGEEEQRLWSILCPLWPEVLTSLGEQVRKCIDPMIITAGGFYEAEGRDAVLARAQLEGRKLSLLRAGEISKLLGHDPLLIALYDQNTKPDPQLVVSHFIDNSLSRASLISRDYPAAEYRLAFRYLAGEMLKYRKIELCWCEVSGWPRLQGDPLRLIGRLAHHGELIRLTGQSNNQRLSFRHDRVRDWLLVDAASELERQSLLTEDVVADPFLAEIMGAVLVQGEANSNFLERLVILNPLSLFHALRLYGQAAMPPPEMILKEINDWLDKPATHEPENANMRWQALAMLAETDCANVPELVRKFRDREFNGQIARFRNGDLTGGIELCNRLNPGMGAPWRDRQIEHVKLRYGKNLTTALAGFLSRMDIDITARKGALRLAGHIADPELAVAIEVCWSADDKRVDHLDDYLWAFAKCCGDNAEHCLGPVCDAWAALPDKSEKENWPSPRNSLAAHELRWAFQKWPPVAAIEYFVQRASRDDLNWPITYMLHGIDHPRAVLYVVQELAAIQRRLEGTKSFSPFLMTAKGDWQRAQEELGRPMSRETRSLLLRLWQDSENDKYLRRQAFIFWAANQDDDDLEILRAAMPSDDLGDSILRERLARGDEQAIPAMIEKIVRDDNDFWWYSGRHVWSEELTVTLDGHLAKVNDRTDMKWGMCFDLDHITSEMIMRLPEIQAERLLLKHWSYLRYSPYFFQTALYVSTPRLLDAVQNAVSECLEPAKLFEHLGIHFGIMVQGHPGLTREAQVLALAPYLDFLSAIEISMLWEACNKHGWFTIRRELLDNRLQHPHKWDPDLADSRLDEMIANNRFNWIDHWIDDFMKTGVSWEEILAKMTEWLIKRGTNEALKVVAAAVECRGTREDLCVFRTFEGTTHVEIRALIADIEFAVRRRSLH